MKAFLKQHKGILIAAAGILLLAAGWVLLWQHLGKQVEQAAYEAVYDQLSFDGAYYVRCELDAVQEYIPEADSIGKNICGSQIGTMTLPAEEGTVECALYACKPLADAGKKNALILLERGESLIAYELAGFQYLDESPNIWAVCSSYGITRPEMFASVSVYDAEGNLLETITEPEALSDFFEKFLRLGEDLGQEGQAKAYYDAYVAEFGASDQILLQNGTVEAVDDAIYEQAMAFWTEGLRLVTIRLTNGLQLRNCIYAPVPGVFSVYGDYAITEPFFAEAP